MRKVRGIQSSDPFAVLGVPPGTDAAEVRSAWRRLAKSAHPDAGGDTTRMQELNDALRAALAHVPARTAELHLDVLPVVACEDLLIAVATLGEVLIADEPYRIEGHLDEPAPCFVTLDLVPVAGGSVVTVEVDGAGPSVESVVEALARALP